MKLAIIATIIGSAAAFAPSSNNGVTSSSNTALQSSTDNMNGWVADSSQPCYGLPGAPYSFMDPLGFTRNRNVNTIKRLREAEVMHGRVAMVST